MEKTKETPSAEELLRRIQELEVRHNHIKLQISKLTQPKPDHQRSNSACSHLRAICGPSVAPDHGGVMDPLAMKLTETQYLNIMESMGQAVHIFDRKHRIHTWNRTAEEIYGFTAAEVFGKTPTEILVDPKDAVFADYLLERTVSGEYWSGEFPVTNNRGETFVVICSNTPFHDENGRLIGGICTSSDSRTYQLMNPKIGPTRNDSLQLRQTSIASKISKLASKVKLKMKADHEGVSADHSDDATQIEASTPHGHIDPSPLGVFLSTGTEEHFTGKLTIHSVDRSGNKGGISNILSSKAEEWMGKKRSLWPWKGNERKDDSLEAKLGQFGWQCMNLNQEHEPGLLSALSDSSSSSGSTSIKSNAIIKVEKERRSLNFEILWEDLITKQQIGQGSCGTVYHGLWYGSDVAIKLFTYQDYSEDVLVSFKQEVSLMKRLRHPNILLFMGAVTSPQRLCIVTELLPRGSLFRILNRSIELDWKRRLHMAMDIARGMNYLHCHNPPIVHRDLKSSNLLVDKNWTVKVGDFGLSCIKHQMYLKTKSGKGTPQWMAPEILRNEQADETSDVYSYGVVLWEIITRKIPWDDLHPMQVIGAVGFMNQRLEIPKDVDSFWASLIESCWRSEPQSRPTFQEILYKLKELQKKLAIERRR